jgi:hypothetical protein
MTTLIASITNEFRRYKTLGEAAIAQSADADLTRAPGDDSNTIAVIVWHVAGNLRSRFTDFRTSDGEKPWRNRDEEFEARTATRQELLAQWDAGWQTLFATLGELEDADLPSTVTIRGQHFTITDALHRALAHVSYHVGQIVYVAKAFKGTGWTSLSIPKGASAAYNQNPWRESPAAHAAGLKERLPPS